MTERIEVLAKTLYFLRTSTPQKPEGSRWERCKDKEKWLRNARQIDALYQERIEQVFEEIENSFRRTDKVFEIERCAYPDENCYLLDMTKWQALKAKIKEE